MSTQTTIDSDELVIGREWIRPQRSGRISVLAAGTEELVGSVPDGTNADIDAAVKAARGAFEDPAGGRLGRLRIARRLWSASLGR
jgi:aldehyde dehydrogenase (NAD+)